MIVDYPAINVDDLDDEAQPYAQAINWQNETIGKTHAMILEMWELFQKVKPLMDSMPMMPTGLAMPPLNNRLPGRR